MNEMKEPHFSIVGKTESQILNNISNLPSNVDVSIDHQELGELTREYIITIFDAVKKKNNRITLNTNGLFLEKYPDLVDKYINDIMYHCISDISSRKDIILYNFKKDIEFVYHIELKKNDSLEDIEYYINKYNDIIFSIYGNIDFRFGYRIYKKFKDHLHVPHLPFLYCRDGYENIKVIL